MRNTKIQKSRKGNSNYPLPLNHQRLNYHYDLFLRDWNINRIRQNNQHRYPKGEEK